MSAWHPAEDADVTGPGTAPTGRTIEAACLAVLSAPDRTAASTTTVARAVAISLLRVRNLERCGA
jgi:Mrp family chromosome partitioning ATPase